MNADFLNEAEGLAPELTALRREIHRCPELGNREKKTAQLVETFLRDCGIETRRPTGDTAVMGILQGAFPGKAVALRADLDALPVQEATGAEFASRVPGAMHACGHDVHTAAVLGAAKLLSRYRDTLHGSVIFLFEPDEEGRGGAKRMVDAGCMAGVDAVFGAHVSPDLPLGMVGVRYGKFYAASDTFTVTVLGRSAHGAQPEKGIDALAAAAKMVTALKALPSRFAPEPAVLSVGTLHAGTAGNIIADRAVFSGILRTLGPDSRAAMKEAFGQTLEHLAAETGTTVETELRESYGGIVNTDGETALVQKTAGALLGADHVVELREPVMTTEDFGCFIDAASGSFYHIGAGCSAPLHSPKFLPDDRAVVVAAALHAAVAAARLSL